ncbi:hypothetical protein LHFGNBLO_001785 [Mesorhizobium sp. AR10]|uniref:hypothetical protein n=1 Tax=Mesorhizobium sp. AR10 TaxID=2865839 RepID=UPI0021609993|nr:hypothetical protein [Mesorhizobium sp. AR10]UVK40332.1 hypothetical protein LHFGNBLO_001785 [Mesorhizobium sp. AR10]
MSLTFIVDREHVDEHQTALRGNGELPDGLPVGQPTSGVGNAGLLGRLWRFASNLPSHLHVRRRRLPAQDDYLRRDIGLSERDIQREYWQYYWWGN